MKDENPIPAQTQRLASLGFMLASVCHEVSNPLAAVSSMLQILQSKRGVTPETLEKGLASIAANIALIPRTLGWDKPRIRARVDELLDLVGLTEARSRKVEDMSKGMQQRLGIAQALVGQPNP